MLAGVAAVAGAMYVATASGSQQSRGPAAKQFKALKTQVATLSKKLKTTQNDLDSLAVAYVHCSLPSEIGVAQKGGSTFGYSFTAGGNTFYTAALESRRLDPRVPGELGGSRRSTPPIRRASLWSAPPPFGTTLPA